MNIQKFIAEWLSASNAFDTTKYLSFYSEEVILDDSSVGRKFEGHTGVKEYFTNYFIGYHTQTRQIKIIITDAENIHLEVEFTGEFPEGRIGGTFDFKLKDGKIIYVKAYLI